MHISYANAFGNGICGLAYAVKTQKHHHLRAWSLEEQVQTAEMAGIVINLETVRGILSQVIIAGSASTWNMVTLVHLSS